MQSPSDKLRKLIPVLEREIQKKRAPRQENTPKRQKESQSQRIDADLLDRVRVAVVKLSEAHEAGECPALLTHIFTKAQLSAYLQTELDTSGGYYSIRDTGKFRNQSQAGVFLREWLSGRETQGEKDERVARDAREKIMAMENEVRFQRIPGFFPTPRALVENMIQAADITPGMKILEPSAGKGDIADGVVEITGCDVFCVEINRALHNILFTKGYRVLNRDFTSIEVGDFDPSFFTFDRILMNPPFESGQDMKHVRHAYKFLKRGGRLVAIMSPGWTFRQDKDASEFRDWALSVRAITEQLASGSFKDSFNPTGVNCVMVVIGKPE